MKKLRRIVFIILVMAGIGTLWVLHEVASLDEIDWDLEQ